jgi:hypothetical protein
VPAQRRQCPRHALLDGQAGGRAPARRHGHRLAVFPPARGNEGLDPPLLHGNDIGAAHVVQLFWRVMGT